MYCQVLFDSVAQQLAPQQNIYAVLRAAKAQFLRLVS